MEEERERARIEERSEHREPFDDAVLPCHVYGKQARMHPSTAAKQGGGPLDDAVLPLPPLGEADLTSALGSVSETNFDALANILAEPRAITVEAPIEIAGTDPTLYACARCRADV